MGKQGEKIKIEVSIAEHNFIKYCRDMKYCEMKVIIMRGEPVKSFEVVKSIRHDIDKVK